MTDNKKMKVTFMPGCFDRFEGTQEELDELMADIQRMADSGELFEKSVPLDMDEFDEFDDDDVTDMINDISSGRTLQ